jgi:hypothetical protein
MAFVHGKNTVFKLNDAAASPTLRDLSAYVNEVSFPRTVETGETTTFGATSDAKTYIVGLNDSSLSVKAMWDSTLEGYLSPGIGSDTLLAFEYGPSGSTAGNLKYSGNAILTSFQTSSPVGDVVSCSIDLQISGPVTRTTW